MEDDVFNMNKQRGAHMDQEPPADPAGDVQQESGQHEAPNIHIDSHAKGHTVHIMHKDGKHEQHEHQKGDAEGIKAHIDKHIGGKQGQDHGFSSGEHEENEYGSGSGV